ncbi:MAG: hypothetical protein A2Y12_17050 [Planctomycetes bacterium GWF2_42_9]|nr:MAG: hypothetical protein A2Y12_17050 [Planctomycetes bacterium GWF2_42_9]
MYTKHDCPPDGGNPLRKPLGKTGISVSQIAFGGAPIGFPYGLGVKGESDLLQETDAIAILKQAFENGINFFDTAPNYGRSENLMGKAFKSIRHDVIIATKCPRILDDNGCIYSFKNLKSLITDSLEKSLFALQSDYVDILFLHDYECKNIVNNSDLIYILEDLKKRGCVRSVGISTYGPSDTEAVLCSAHWDVVQLAFNLMDQRELVNFKSLQTKGIGVVVRSALFKGILTDKVDTLHPALISVQNHRQRYFKFINENIKSLYELAIKFILSFDAVSTVLIGIDKADYLEKAIGIFSNSQISETTIKELCELAYPEPEFLNLPKWDKLGWLK